MIVTDHELAEFRAEAIGEMTSQVTLWRLGVTAAAGNGFVTDTWTKVATDVPFGFAGNTTTSTTQRTGDVATDAAVRTGKFPHDFEDLADHDLVEITCGESAGKVFKILDSTWKDRATARRVKIVEHPRPAEWI